MIRRIQIKESIRSIVYLQQSFKVKILDYNMLQSLPHFRQVCRSIYQRLWSSGKSPAITTKTFFDKTKVSCGPLDICFPTLAHIIEKRLP